MPSITFVHVPVGGKRPVQPVFLERLEPVPAKVDVRQERADTRLPRSVERALANIATASSVRPDSRYARASATWAVTYWG
jgi:hypothetical protein